jgi:hypothetical protein
MNFLRHGCLLVLSLLSLSAYADWQCYTVDTGGHYWTSPGTTRERACAVAMNFCSAHSGYGGCSVNKCFQDGVEQPL